MRTLITLFIFFFVITGTVASQIREKDHLKVKVEVNVTPVDSGFIYEYTVTNRPESQQTLWTITFATGDYWIHKNATLRDFSSSPNGFWSATVLDEVVIPHSNATSIIGWTSSYIKPVKSVKVLYHPPIPALEPSEGTILKFKSNGLPSVMKFWAEGWTKPITEEEVDSLVALGFELKELLKPWYENSYKGRTIAPVLVGDIANSVFADSLLSYLDFSCNNDWVTNHGICNSLQAKMRNVAKQLGKGKIKQAINGLSAFIHEVQAQRGKHITPEGYAVLFYNAQYLIEQLKKQSGGKKENKSRKKNKK